MICLRYRRVVAVDADWDERLRHATDVLDSFVVLKPFHSLAFLPELYQARRASGEKPLAKLGSIHCMEGVEELVRSCRSDSN